MSGKTPLLCLLTGMAVVLGVLSLGMAALCFGKGSYALACVFAILAGANVKHVWVGIKALRAI